MYKEYTIDKSLLTAEELAQYEALVAKATVDPAANKEGMEEEVPPVVPPTKKKPAKKAEEEEPVEEAKKSAEQSPEIKAAMEDLANLKKSYEMDKMKDVAKKYAPLNKKEDELAQTLYEMKKSNPANYDAYIAILDESLALVEKSGLFAEIGKSGNAGGSYSGLSGAEAKADAKAKEIMKADPNMSYTAAIAKAWDDPELSAEYDAEYFGN